MICGVIVSASEADRRDIRLVAKADPPRDDEVTTATSTTTAAVVEEENDASEAPASAPDEDVCRGENTCKKCKRAAEKAIKTKHPGKPEHDFLCVFFPITDLCIRVPISDVEAEAVDGMNAFIDDMCDDAADDGERLLHHLWMKL